MCACLCVCVCVCECKYYLAQKTGDTESREATCHAETCVIYHQPLQLDIKTIFTFTLSSKLNL